MERASIRRVEQAGVFKGVTHSKLLSAAESAVKDGRIQLRPGWRELFTAVLESGGSVNVVSVSWSARFLRAILGCAGLEREVLEKKGNSGVGVLANEFRTDGSLTRGRNTRWYEAGEGADEAGWRVGSFEGEEGWSEDHDGIWTVDGKVDVMKQVLEQVWDNGDDAMEETKPRVVVVGDSVTDLGMLVKADVGVVFRGGGRDGAESGEEKELKQTLDRIGLQCRWIRESGKVKHEEPKKADMLWWSKDFQEIRDVLFR